MKLTDRTWETLRKEIIEDMRCRKRVRDSKYQNLDVSNKPQWAVDNHWQGLVVQDGRNDIRWKKRCRMDVDGRNDTTWKQRYTMEVTALDLLLKNMEVRINGQTKENRSISFIQRHGNPQVWRVFDITEMRRGDRATAYTISLKLLSIK